MQERRRAEPSTATAAPPIKAEETALLWGGGVGWVGVGWGWVRWGRLKNVPRHLCTPAVPSPSRLSSSFVPSWRLCWSRRQQEVAVGGGEEEAVEGRASPSPSVPSLPHASGSHPPSLTPPSPPVTTFLWGLLINRPSISIMPPKLLFVALRGRNNQYVLWGQRAH